MWDGKMLLPIWEQFLSLLLIPILTLGPLALAIRFQDKIDDARIALTVVGMVSLVILGSLVSALYHTVVHLLT